MPMGPGALVGRLLVERESELSCKVWDLGQGATCVFIQQDIQLATNLPVRLELKCSYEAVIFSSRRWWPPLWGWQTSPQTPVVARGGQARLPGSSTTSDQTNHAHDEFWCLCPGAATGWQQCWGADP